MRSHYRLGTLTATAETDTTAARLEADGWQRITPAQHRAAWTMRDMTDLQRIAVEDWLMLQDTPVPVKVPTMPSVGNWVVAPKVK